MKPERAQMKSRVRTTLIRRLCVPRHYRHCAQGSRASVRPWGGELKWKYYYSGFTFCGKIDIIIMPNLWPFPIKVYCDSESRTFRSYWQRPVPNCLDKMRYGCTCMCNCQKKKKKKKKATSRRWYVVWSTFSLRLLFQNL